MHFPPVNFGSCWVFECNIHRKLFYFCHLIPGKDVSLPLSCEFQCLQRSNVYVTSHVIHPVMWFIWPIISELEKCRQMLSMHIGGPCFSLGQENGIPHVATDISAWVPDLSLDSLEKSHSRYRPCTT